IGLAHSAARPDRGAPPAPRMDPTTIQKTKPRQFAAPKGTPRPASAKKTPTPTPTPSPKTKKTPNPNKHKKEKSRRRRDSLSWAKLRKKLFLLCSLLSSFLLRSSLLFRSCFFLSGFFCSCHFFRI